MTRTRPVRAQGRSTPNAPLFMAIGLFAASLSALAGAAPVDPNTTLEDRLRDGRAALERRAGKEALQAFKEANALRKGDCADCLIGMAKAYRLMRDDKKAIDRCEDVLAMLAADPKQRALAYSLRGIALMNLSGGTSKKKLADSEADFRKARALDPEDPNITYNLGVLLLTMKRDDEGKQELTAYLKRVDSGAAADEARELIENPRRAGGKYAPSFTLVDSTGKRFSLSDLSGKVVLLDFWGTFCHPCLDALPSLRNLHESLAERPFVMLAVSGDPDEYAWREFIKKTKEPWPQFYDRDETMRRAFGVNAFPTYIVIDQDGMIRAKIVGWRPTVRAEIESALRIASKATK